MGTGTRLIAAVLIAGALGGGSAAVRFDNFDSTDGLTLVGDTSICGNVVRLTRARQNQSGAVWSDTKQPIASGFETTFQFQLTHQGGMGHGADGLAFVLQNSGADALGGRGSAGGFAVEDPNFHHKRKGIPWSVAVFFDTYKNDEEGDPSDNYVAICTHGRPAELRWPANRLASTPELRVQLKDRQLHTARIVFQPPVVSVFLDGSADPVLQAPVDLSIVTDPAGRAWVGFTASTGGGYENHDILNWSFTSAAVSSSISAVDSDISFPIAACLPDHNLCTPERAIVEKTAAGYHVVLPGNVAWGASIPDRSMRQVSVTNAHGIVCWNARARGAGGCSGPAGNGTAAGSGFLAEDTPAGALIMTVRDDHVWFSVNGQNGSGFRDNEGFFEFDVASK